MKCKNCKQSMMQTEHGEEDGLTIIIWECENCNWKCKMWRNLDPDDLGFGDNESWIDGDDNNVD
jgi:hypothetical protein